MPGKTKDAPTTTQQPDVALLPEFADLTPTQEQILLTLPESGLHKVDLTKGPENRLNKPQLAEQAGVTPRTVLHAYQRKAFVTQRVAHATLE